MAYGVELVCATNLQLKKKAKAGNELSNILPKSSHARKKPQPLVRNRFLTFCQPPRVISGQSYMCRVLQPLLRHDKPLASITLTEGRQLNDPWQHLREFPQLNSASRDLAKGEIRYFWTHLTFPNSLRIVRFGTERVTVQGQRALSYTGPVIWNSLPFLSAMLGLCRVSNYNYKSTSSPSIALHALTKHNRSNSGQIPVHQCACVPASLCVCVCVCVCVRVRVRVCVHKCDVGEFGSNLGLWV